MNHQLCEVITKGKSACVTLSARSNLSEADLLEAVFMVVLTYIKFDLFAASLGLQCQSGDRDNMTRTEENFIFDH